MMTVECPTSTVRRGKERHKDNFAAIRLLAAMAVVFGHSFALTGGVAPSYLGSAVSTLAVKVFFVVSGYLISESWMRDANVPRYLLRRCLRILPALAAVCLFSILIVGPLFTTLSLPDYFANANTWSYLNNIILSPVYYLPGVFTGNIYPGAINGSLWTLPVEFAMYLLVPVVLVLPWPRPTLGLATLAFSAASVWLTRLSIPPSPPVVWGTSLISALEMAPYFFWGALYRVWDLRRILNTQVAILLIVFLPLVVVNWASAEAVALLLVPYVVLSVGYSVPPAFGWFDRYGDVSYGAYLYGFLCQQIVSHLFPSPNNPWLNFILAMPLTLGFAVISWRLIEEPALRLKPRREAA